MDFALYWPSAWAGPPAGECFAQTINPTLLPFFPLYTLYCFENPQTDVLLYEAERLLAWRAAPEVPQRAAGLPAGGGVVLR
jgi:hypothetical protein